MAKKAAKEKELKLEDILFNCRDQLRGKASMADKRDLLLTLVFLRFVGEKFTNQRQAIYDEQIAKGRDPEKDAEFIASKMEYKPAYAKAGVFYLPEECRWEAISSANADATLPMNLDNIINQLELDNASLKGALPQKIFSSAGIAPKDLKAVIDEVGKISQARFPERDLIGRVYEYFLQAFAFQVKDSKEEGEFYTPHSIVNLIASIIEPIDGTIYDPCCGSGGMFVQSMKVIEAHGGNTKAVSVYGQELQPETYRLAKMNLAVRGISHDLGNEPASTFLNDKHKDKKMDYIITNPPFNLKKWRAEDELTSDPRWSGYDIPPVSNANYAWILHILNKLNVDTGIAGFLLANGALDDSDTVSIRQKLIENDKVEAIMILPRNMFYTTDTSVTLWIINQNKKGGVWHGRNLRDRTGEVLFVDLRTWRENIYEKKYVRFSDEQIKKVCDIYWNWQTTESETYAEPELYYSAKKEEIEAKGWTLVPSRYIEFVDRGCSIDIDSAVEQADEIVRKINSVQENFLSKLSEILKIIASFKSLEDKYPLVEIGPYLEEVDERNSDLSVTLSQGVANTKVFQTPKQVSANSKSDKIVRTGQFAYNRATTRNGEKISIAYREGPDCTVSSAYEVFYINDETVIDPHFLLLWFSRPEFDRYARYKSKGSAHEFFDFGEMCRVQIPLPPIEIQKAIVKIYQCSQDAREIATQADKLKKDICPALLQHIIHQ